MKKLLTLLVLVVILGSTTMTSAQPVQPQLPPPVHLVVPNRLQQTQVWCWAAASQQIIEWSRGSSPPQCALVAEANNVLPQVCCGVVNPACVRTGTMLQIQSLIAFEAGRGSHVIPPPNDPATLYYYLQRGQPVILQIRTNPTATHVVVLVGMAFMRTQFGPVAILEVNDPMSMYTQPVTWQAIASALVNGLVID